MISERDMPHARSRAGKVSARGEAGKSMTVCRIWTAPVVRDLNPLPPADSRGAMATVFAATAGSDAYRIERLYLNRDQADRFAQDYNGIAHVEPVQVKEWQTGAPPGAYEGLYWRAQLWSRVPVSKPRSELRRTGAGERFDEFDIRQEWWTGEALPDGKVVRGELAAGAEDRGVRPVEGEVEELSWETITQVRADLAGVPRT
jgi:hypothetical protein